MDRFQHANTENRKWLKKNKDREHVYEFHGNSSLLLCSSGLFLAQFRKPFSFFCRSFSTLQVLQSRSFSFFLAKTAFFLFFLFYRLNFFIFSIKRQGIPLGSIVKCIHFFLTKMVEYILFAKDTIGIGRIDKVSTANSVKMLLIGIYTCHKHLLHVHMRGECGKSQFLCFLQQLFIGHAFLKGCLRKSLWICSFHCFKDRIIILKRGSCFCLIHERFFLVHKQANSFFFRSRVASIKESSDLIVSFVILFSFDFHFLKIALLHFLLKNLFPSNRLFLFLFSCSFFVQFLYFLLLFLLFLLFLFLFFFLLCLFL
eukprot:m.45128 g.45128  ORF g.45128 m.45128 type:complete len:313 (-) comp7204_c0_seq1:224-1162(-)